VLHVAFLKVRVLRPGGLGEFCLINTSSIRYIVPYGSYTLIYTTDSNDETKQLLVEQDFDQVTRDLVSNLIPVGLSESMDVLGILERLIKAMESMIPASPGQGSGQQ
jgi:hypothetical protein